MCREDGPSLRMDQLVCWIEKLQAFPELFDITRVALYLWCRLRLRYSLRRGGNKKPKEYIFYYWRWLTYRGNLVCNILVSHAITPGVYEYCTTVPRLRFYAFRFYLLPP